MRSALFWARLMQGLLTPLVPMHALQAADPSQAVAGAVEFGPGRYGGEAYFVPSSTSAAAAGAPAEDSGYLVTFVHDDESDQTELVVYDAATMAPKVGFGVGGWGRSRQQCWRGAMTTAGSASCMRLAIYQPDLAAAPASAGPGLDAWRNRVWGAHMHAAAGAGRVQGPSQLATRCLPLCPAACGAGADAAACAVR